MKDEFTRRELLKAGTVAAVVGNITVGQSSSPKAKGGGSRYESEVPVATVQKDFIAIKNRKTLAADRLPAERVYIGSYYKPSLVRMPNNELRLVAEATQPHPNLHADNPHPIFRSTDGGRSWAQWVIPDLTGGEPYLIALKDGALMMTGDILVRSKGPAERNVLYMIKRSADGGRTWYLSETGAVQRPEGVVVGSRNVLELADKSLMYGVSNRPRRVEKLEKGEEDFIWGSFDGGHSWPEKYHAEFEGVPRGYPFCVLEEAYLWQGKSGDIYAICRVSPSCGAALAWPCHQSVPLTSLFPLPARLPPLMPPQFKSRYEDMRDHWQPEQGPYSGDDGVFLDDYDRMIVYSSSDFGRTWKKVRDLGDYGEHYPSILCLQDGRLLLTFTVRAGKDQLGVQAVIGTETPDGFDFDLEYDRIVIESKTPMNMVSGGGFGNTVQLRDGMVVTCYSYRLAKGNRGLHTEVVRWRVPENRR